MIKRLYKKYLLIALLLVSFISPVHTHAADLRAVKDLQPGYTTIAYYNKKNNKYCYTTIDLVIRKKSANSVLASQLPNKYRLGSKARFSLAGKEKAYCKSGKTVRLSSLKNGAKIRVIYKNGLLETSPLRFVDIIRIDLR